MIHDGRALDQEMDEAAQRAAEVTGLEKNPLLIILYRLSHQDRQLESIRIDMDTMARMLDFCHKQGYKIECKEFFTVTNDPEPKP